MTEPGMYAVAVRDEKLYLFLRIKRNRKGEVFVIFSREDNDWDPHSSVHKNGTHHQKSFNHKFAVQTRQKPSAQFQRTSNVVETGISLDEARAINVECKPSEFSHIFEICADNLRPEKY